VIQLDGVSAVYLDTSVFIGAIFPGTPNATSCQQVCRDLQQANTTVCFSQCLRLEYARAVRRLATKTDRLPLETAQEFRLSEWGTNPLVRQRWYGRAVRLLDEILARFWEVDELPFTAEVWRASVEVMAVEALDATDACHIATARNYGIGLFMTCDADFQRIRHPEIVLIRDN
jgi:predicted nucleic acid-binding protein